MAPFLREVSVWMLLGGITAGGVYLVQQNRALTGQNRRLAREVVEPRAGLFVPEYPVTTIDQAPVTLGAVGQRQVLIFFRTTCPYSRASTPAWNAVAARLQDHPEISVYGVALDSADATRTYGADHQLRFPLIARPDPRLIGLYRVSGVPLIVVVSEEGRMAYARLGVLDAAAAVDSVVTAARTPGPPSRDSAPEASGRPGGRRGSS